MTRFLDRPVNPYIVHSFSRMCAGDGLELFSVSFASAAWTANRLILIPLVTGQKLLVKGVWWYNGATVNGNTDVGVYSIDGTVKYGSSGSTGNSGTNTLQDVDVTDFYLPAQSRFWMVLGSDSGTQTYFRLAFTAFMQDFIGIKEHLSGWSSGLPSTITPAASTVAVVPMFGLRGSTVI